VNYKLQTMFSRTPLCKISNVALQALLFLGLTVMLTTPTERVSSHGKAKCCEKSGGNILNQTRMLCIISRAVLHLRLSWDVQTEQWI